MATPATFDVKDQTAVVTGAAGGIGRAIACSLAVRGCHLALADVNEDGLAETARLVGNQARVSRHRLDVADRAAVAAFPGVVAQTHPGVDILVNNAGVAIGGDFEKVSEEDFDWLLEINLMGVIRMTRAFLPTLRESERAQIVNVSSLFGLIAPAGQCAYSTAKFGVRGFSNSLRHELMDTSIGVTVVHPGGVATGIASAARVPVGVSREEEARRKAEMNKSLKMPPAEAGEIIVKGIERRKARVIVGNDARIVSAIERLMPVNYWSVIRRLAPR